MAQNIRRNNFFETKSLVEIREISFHLIYNLGCNFFLFNSM